MAYMITEYNYEGTAEIYCKECETTFEVEFTGDDSIKIKDSITEALLELGWSHDCCPSCIEEDEDESDTE